MGRRTLLSDSKLDTLRGLLERLTVPGDLAELGVYRGGVSRLLAQACPGRTVHLFDTFTGIPWDGYMAKVDRHRPGEFAEPLDEVRDYLIDCPNVVFHPGLFPYTTEGVDARFALVHLDADLYASTLAGLRWFWPRLNIGGSIVLDDWHWPMCPGVEQAVNEFFKGIPTEMHEPAPHQLVIEKP